MLRTVVVPSCRLTESRTTTYENREQQRLFERQPFEFWVFLRWYEIRMVRCKAQKAFSDRTQSCQRPFNRMLSSLQRNTFQEIRLLQQWNKKIPLPWLRSGVFPANRNCVWCTQDSRIRMDRIHDSPFWVSFPFQFSQWQQKRENDGKILDFQGLCRSYWLPEEYRSIR